MKIQLTGKTLDECEAQLRPSDTVLRTDGSRVTGHVVLTIERAAHFEWASIGEGIDGAYDPDNPRDVELLRLDLIDDSDECEGDSYCTSVPVTTSTDEQARLLNVATEAYGEGISMKVLSWMLPGWTLDNARATQAAIYGMSSSSPNTPV